METEKRRTPELESLPGGDLVIKGLEDLRKSVISEEALLVLIAGPRLAGLGIEVPEPRNAAPPYEHALYSLIERRCPQGAHATYNALIRRIVSFAQAYSQVHAE